MVFVLAITSCSVINLILHVWWNGALVATTLSLVNSERAISHTHSDSYTHDSDEQWMWTIAVLNQHPYLFLLELRSILLFTFPIFFIYIVVAVCLRSNRNITFGHGAAESLFRKIKIKRAVRFEAVILIQFSGPENEIMGKRTIFTKTPTHKNKGKNDEKDERKQNGYLKN